MISNCSSIQRLPLFFIDQGQYFKSLEQWLKRILFFYDLYRTHPAFLICFPLSDSSFFFLQAHLEQPDWEAQNVCASHRSRLLRSQLKPLRSEAEWWCLPATASTLQVLQDVACLCMFAWECWANRTHKLKALHPRLLEEQDVEGGEKTDAALNKQPDFRPATVYRCAWTRSTADPRRKRAESVKRNTGRREGSNGRGELILGRTPYNVKAEEKETNTTLSNEPQLNL